MGMPAARLGDLTAHGGTIVVGFPTVLIGGMPAARLGDLQVCPMVTGVVPHVGGPIAMGSPTVLIGGMPAARVTDVTTCVGPPGVIALGCFTVLIGVAGGAGGGGGGGGGGAMGLISAVVAAMLSAITAMTGGGTPGSGGGQGGGPGSTPGSNETHWIEFQFVDTAGNPVSGVQYEFTAPDGTEREGRLGSDGRIYWSGQDAGQGTVKLMSVTNARWSEEDARAGDTVTLTADVEGFDPGTPVVLKIYEQDVGGADDYVATIETETQGDSVEAEWEYVYTEDTDDVMTQEETRGGYSSPEYYFEVTVGQSKARSGLLRYKDYIEIELKDADDEPVADREYFLYLPSGEVRRGRLDANGYAREDNVPPGHCGVRFLGEEDETTD